MTDVLLAHSFFIKNDSKQIEKMRPYAPLGTLYAAANLRAQGYSVALFDAMFAEGVHEFEALVRQHRPRIVALYEDQFNWLNKMCLMHAREAACEMAKLARSHGATVIAAGSDVSDHPEVYIESGVDFALQGEADHHLIEIVNRVTRRSGADVVSVQPASTSDLAPGQIVGDGQPERRPDVFPFPAWDLFDVERYRRAWIDKHGYFSLNMVSTRGCPFHCNWCAKPIWGQRYAMRSPANVAEEMALVKRTLRPDQIWFADDIFGLRPRWVAEFADEVEQRDASIPFMIQTRVDLMTEKAVAGLARAGCAEAWLGVESGSQRILDAMDKGTKLPQIPIARRLLGDAGIKTCFFVQLGYPGETLDDIMATVGLIRDTMPDDIGVSVSYPLPGTKFHNMVKAQLCAKDHWDESNDMAMMFQGTYKTPIYRKLHKLLHRDLELRQRIKRNGGANDNQHGELLREIDAVNHAWFEVGRMERENRSANPTAIEKDYAPVTAPDLSKPWN